MALKRDGRLMPFDEQVIDLCKELETKFELQCPVKSGVETRQRSVSLNSGVDDGEYVVVVLDAWTRFQERITCLQGSLKF